MQIVENVDSLRGLRWGKTPNPSIRGSRSYGGYGFRNMERNQVGSVSIKDYNPRKHTKIKDWKRFTSSVYQASRKVANSEEREFLFAADPVSSTIYVKRVK
jgi:hypothetical protein